MCVLLGQRDRDSVVQCFQQLTCPKPACFTSRIVSWLGQTRCDLEKAALRKQYPDGYEHEQEKSEVVSSELFFAVVHNLGFAISVPSLNTRFSRRSCIKQRRDVIRLTEIGSVGRSKGRTL